MFLVSQKKSKGQWYKWVTRIVIMSAMMHLKTLRTSKTLYSSF
jgi:hypothetical protein